MDIKDKSIETKFVPKDQILEDTDKILFEFSEDYETLAK